MVFLPCKSRDQLFEEEKSCRIKGQGSDSEEVLGRTAARSRHYVEVLVRGK